MAERKDSSQIPDEEVTLDTETHILPNGGRSGEVPVRLTLVDDPLTRAQIEDLMGQGCPQGWPVDMLPKEE